MPDPIYDPTQQMGQALLGAPPPDYGIDPSVAAALGTGVAKSLWNKAKDVTGIPSRVFDAENQYQQTGKLNPAPYLEAAQLLVGTGMPMAEEGAAGIFGGRLAQKANLAKLNDAKSMEMQGLNPNQIHTGTGWFRGADGEWRFEIPDNKADFHTYGDTVGQTMSHPELYKNYPELANRPVTYNAKTNTANYDPGTGGMNLSLYTDQRKQLPIALHEAQHAIQHMEGFANGTNRNAMETAVLNELKRQGAELPQQDVKTAAMEAYLRHAGEVEARNVEARQPMTKYERKIVPPWSTEDRARSNQIVAPPFPRFQDPATQMINALKNPPR